ncbi:MAG: DUF4962 domain-containing protein [Firmicutes bacterium]|nr:DUF4962 domain-containing protein [Bacillota bacterium]
MENLLIKDWNLLRSERFDVRAQAFRRLADQCRRYEKEILPAEHPLKSITYYGMAALNLALMYRLTNQKYYLSSARRWIFAGVQYPHWGKAVKVDVDLSASWLLLGYGIAYDWLKNDLEPADRQDLLEKLILQGERMYAYACATDGAHPVDQKRISQAEAGAKDVLTGRSWATTYWQNHNWINMTGLYAAALAIRDQYSPAEEWIRYVQNNFEKVFPLLPEDGSDYEGVVYWRYGVIFLFLYAELEREHTGRDRFRESDFLKNTFFYRLYQLGPDREQNFNFGDCHDRKSGHIPCLYRKVASEYRNGYAQMLAREVLEHSLMGEGYESGVKPGILPEACLEYIWYDPEVKEKPLEELETSHYFADLGLFSWRSGWDREAIAFSFKCAPGGGHKQWELAHAMEKETGLAIRSMGHHHPDANHFMLLRGSDFLAVDEGYSAHKMARNHNLILVDGKGFTGDGAYDVYRDMTHSQQGRILAYEPHGKGFYLCGSSASLYDKSLGVKSMRREILSAGTGWFLILDSMCADAPRTWTWLLHMDQPAQRLGDHYRLEIAGSAMEVYMGDPELRFGSTLMENSANVTSQEPDNIVYTRLFTICQENKMPAGAMRFCTLITAGSAREGALPTVSNVQTEDGWTVRVGEDEIIIRGDERILMTTREQWVMNAPSE